MAELRGTRPDKSPLPILLFLAMFPVYAFGVCLGFNIRVSEFFAIFDVSDGNELLAAVVLGLIPLLLPLVLGLFAIRTIMNGTRLTAGIVGYLICLVLCLFVGVFMVPIIWLSS